MSIAALWVYLFAIAWGLVVNFIAPTTAGLYVVACLLFTPILLSIFGGRR